MNITEHYFLQNSESTSSANEKRWLQAMRLRVTYNIHTVTFDRLISVKLLLY